MQRWQHHLWTTYRLRPDGHSSRITAALCRQKTKQNKKTSKKKKNKTKWPLPPAAINQQATGLISECKHTIPRHVNVTSVVNILRLISCLEAKTLYREPPRSLPWPKQGNQGLLRGNAAHRSTPGNEWKKAGEEAWWETMFSGKIVFKPKTLHSRKY